MFSTTVFVLIYGIISICAQECKDVRMMMSSIKPGRVELDVDQFCRCAGYSRTATADESEHLKWKKPTRESDFETEKTKIKDESTTMKTIYGIIDTLREGTKENITDESHLIVTTKKVIETKSVTDESYTETIDKIPIIVTTTENISTISTDKPKTHEKITLTSDIASEKEVVLVEDTKSTHYIRNSTEKDIIPTIPTTEKRAATEIADEGVFATESTFISMSGSVEDKTGSEKTSTPSTSEKYSGIATKSNGTGLIYSVATTLATEEVTIITTEKSVDKFTYEDSDTATGESPKIDDITVKSPTPFTTKKIGVESTTVKVTDKMITRKPHLDSTTDILIDKTNSSITEESAVKGIFKDSTTKTSDTDVYVPYHISRMPYTTTEDYEYEKKAENSSEAVPEKSHMTEGSDYGLQIFLVLACIIVCSVFMLAVIYTVYMSHRSNSYVLPAVEDTTPLNQI